MVPNRNETGPGAQARLFTHGHSTYILFSLVYRLAQGRIESCKATLLSVVLRCFSRWRSRQIVAASARIALRILANCEWSPRLKIRTWGTQSNSKVAVLHYHRVVSSLNGAFHPSTTTRAASLGSSKNNVLLLFPIATVGGGQYTSIVEQLVIVDAASSYSVENALAVAHGKQRLLE